MGLDEDKTIGDGLTLDGEVLPEARKALLVYHRDGLEVVGLEPDEAVVIGRSRPSHVLARSRRLSRQHARFELREDTVFVLDLDSTNGTWVNGRRIREEVPLSEDDEVTIGSVSISVQTLGAVEGRLHGLLSHERFVAALGRAIGDARRSREPLGLLMVRALGGRGRLSRWVPRVRDLLRMVDVVGLYGPDAIEILLPGADRERARRLAEDVIGGRGSEEPALACGLVQFPDDGVGADELIEAARAALHEAEADGGLGERALAVIPADGEPAGPVVRDPQMVELYRSIDRIARSAISVLVLGETGTGKEVVARAIHDRSERRDGPMRTVNCGAIPETLLESVLFGHERGAFTGADRQRRGLFEEARGGTLFLDEIGELSPSAQVALLRVLETRRIQRVGSSDEIDVDVRVVAATHRDLETMCEQGSFRWDLLYRLNPLTLRLPPLRERPSEIRALVEHFVREANQINGRGVQTIQPEALALLERYPWPGNVRELRNALERAVVIAFGDSITVDDLPDRVRDWRPPDGSELPDFSNTPEPTEYVTAGLPLAAEQLDLKARVAELEQQLIHSALRACGGNQSEAAVLLKIPRRTLVYKIRSYDIGEADPAAPPLEPAADERGNPLEFRERIERFEGQLLREALIRADGDRGEAARLLGIQKRTLDTKCDRLGIESDRR